MTGCVQFKGHQDTNRPVNWSRPYDGTLAQKLVKQKAAAELAF